MQSVEDDFITGSNAYLSRMYLRLNRLPFSPASPRSNNIIRRCNYALQTGKEKASINKN